LVEWVKNFKKKPQKVFLVHGEEESLSALHDSIRDELGLDVTIPKLGEDFLIEGNEEAIPLETIKEKTFRNALLFEEKADELRELLESVMEKLEEKTKQNIKEEDIHKYMNKILELKKEGLELSMMMTDRNKLAR